MDKKIEYKTGEKCKVCGKGKIALGYIFVDTMELDQEPFESGKIELNGEDMRLNDNVNISVHACTSCGEIYDISIQNSNLKYKYKK